MIARFRVLLRTQMSRYLIVGASVYGFELVVIIVAQHFGASSLVAVSISFWLGLIVSFILQKFITFADKRTHRHVLVPQVVAVSLLVLFNFGFTLLVTKLLGSATPAVISRTCALVATTTWNFYLYKTRIFKTTLEPVY